jgi:hypothetical protein
MDAHMPIVETYRGVGIHDFQDAERIELVVKPAIDEVFTMSDPRSLFAYARDQRNPPEARLFAGDKIHAGHDINSARHVNRERVDLELVDAATAGLTSLGWADHEGYGSMIDVRSPGEEGHAPRPPEQRARLEAAKEVARQAERAGRSRR